MKVGDKVHVHTENYGSEQGSMHGSFYPVIIKAVVIRFDTVGHDGDALVETEDGSRSWHPVSSCKEPRSEKGYFERLREEAIG